MFIFYITFNVFMYMHTHTAFTSLHKYPEHNSFFQASPECSSINSLLFALYQNMLNVWTASIFTAHLKVCFILCEAKAKLTAWQMKGWCTTGCISGGNSNPAITRLVSGNQRTAVYNDRRTADTSHDFCPLNLYFTSTGFQLIKMTRQWIQHIKSRDYFSLNCIISKLRDVFS